MAVNSWRYNKDILLVVLGGVIIVLVILLASKNSSNNQQSTNGTAKIGISQVAITPSGMKYPTGWQELSQINLADKSASVISEAVHSNPDAQAIIRINQGPLANGFDINKSVTETIGKLKSNLTSFTLVSNKIIQLGKNQAINITYKYSNAGQMYEQTQVIVPTSKKTYFLTITAKESNFKQITDSDKILIALSKYVASN